ncbi:Competence protein A [Novipirellula galeiformis]|uniref:Competence protein A n=2 Tax=Novipirellula galeiformis TaxID=2528004 RepID=A0A5C6C8H3_9BACT|nr:Competence protein A [Novipirellula galeiformis]
MTPFAATSRGWIGIDIGSRSIKLAQVERVGDQFHFGNRWTVTRPENLLASNVDMPNALAGKPLGLAELRELFSRSECAAALSMSFHTLRSIELPAASAEEMRDMVNEELAAEASNAESDCVFDFWNTHEATDEAAHVTTLSMPTSVATGVAKDLLQAGYECQVLDGLPCALARAVTMANDDHDSPVAALDLGDGEFTFVLIARGQPLYTRVLRGGGLCALLQPLKDALNLSHEQAMQLLIRYAVGSGEHGGRAMNSGPAQLLEQPMMLLVQELKRTLDFVAQPVHREKPAELILFGGGASIRNLSSYLSQHLGLPTRNWRLPSSTPQFATDDARYGVAAALSVLRWEQRTCS